jgi:hypothetical protein
MTLPREEHETWGKAIQRRILEPIKRRPYSPIFRPGTYTGTGTNGVVESVVPPNTESLNESQNRNLVEHMVKEIGSG